MNYFDQIADGVLEGVLLPEPEAYELGDRVAKADEAETAQLAKAALRVKEAHFAKNIGLCSIINAKSGSCSEDCKFCAQSAHYAGECNEYPFVGVDKILEAAGRMKEAGASRFSVVTSGKGLTGKDFKELVAAIEGIRALGMKADASVGILTAEQLNKLKDAGLDAYHHNLEVSRSFFPQICTTHDYDEDVNTVRASLAAGLYVCSGGLFGLGEEWKHRVELALELRTLGVQSVPVNFLSPIPGTPFEGRGVMPKDEAVRIVALLRLILPTQHIRICGGRPAVFGKDKAEVLSCGASGLMIGDYLTTKGEDVASDMEDLQRLGLCPEE